MPSTRSERQRRPNDICLAHWWMSMRELDKSYNYNDIFAGNKSLLFKFLQESAIFHEKFGDKAIPTHQRVKVHKCEMLAKIQPLHRVHYDVCYDRECMHDPIQPNPRHNKDRGLWEHFENLHGTWIAATDKKPCNCSKCTRV